MDLLRAAQYLCQSKNESYKKARNYAVTELRFDANADCTFTVVSNQSCDDPILFQLQTDRCKSCIESVAIQRQCKRMICLRGLTFFKEYRLVCHMRQSRMSSSLNGWKRMSRETVAEQLGLCGDTTAMRVVHLSNLFTTTEDKEGCVDDIEENDKALNPYDLLSNTCRPLSKPAFQEVTSQVNYCYVESTDRVKLTVGAILIKMRDISVTKGKVNSMIDLFDGVEFACAHIVNLHNSACFNSMNQSTPPSSFGVTVQHPPTVLVSSNPKNKLKKKTINT